ncbi:MAG: SMP-30/gluconolactonase/LRE family protein [Okeania sp. SIO3B3]|nr:SMP-30/gluconolactonase/LRE family protein [Okeania sp. SIO3B3]
MTTEHSTIADAEPLLSSGRVFRLAENPLWDAQRGTLFITDIDAGELYRVTPGDADAELIYRGPKVGGFTLEEDGNLALSRESDIARFDPDAHETTGSIPAARDGRQRFNDVIALPDGSALAGSIGSDGRPTPLVHVRPGGSMTDVSGAASAIGNGFAWIAAGGLLWTDTPGRRLVRLALGSDGVRVADKAAYRVPDTATEGFPDGLTSDPTGRLYSARWAGGCVVVLDPCDAAALRWEPVGRIGVGAANVTACTFGGPSMNTLYITTAGGGLYRVTADRSGSAEFRSRIFCD